MPTIGVAIPVPEPWGSELRAHRADFGDPEAARIPSHVTLLPPTEVEDTDLPKVYEKLADDARAVDPFPMRLRGTGTFRPVSPVVFVAVSEGISSTEVLAKHVRDGLLVGQLEFPYHPHVTVAHHLDDAALDRAYATLADFECDFEVRSFALYRHDDADGWSPSQEFTLG
ncbi:2'-5' RNA ligase [Mumia flava]|uniref:2'-5' RNA ligase n=1 Tax=Mumia flava TaxID=1348852 RepID=A0A0B2BHL7_9ACTN|nr:2'-5' RNA ligase family protein [Mumia flava]PJJ58460.1 2'-5' RNA ligase [Mumia flava]